MRLSPLVVGLSLVVALGACRSSESARPEPVMVREGAGRGTLPTEVDTSDRYLFYLHGAIVENRGVRPVHPRYGVYEYKAILDTLSRRGFTVISEARPPGTRPEAYAEKVTAEIDSLLGAGVRPEHITVVGFSKGGAIALMVSSYIENDHVNFVFLASCSDWMLSWPGLDPKGRVLSMYDARDEIAGSCKEVFGRATGRLEYEEIELDVGLGHGTFYRPLAEWVEPVVQWASGRDLGLRG